MISEESCCTDSWSNDFENLTGITGIKYILKYIKLEKNLPAQNFKLLLFLL